MLLRTYAPSGMVLSVAAMLLIHFTELHAADPLLQTMGYTKDNDDVPFLDFKLSVKYPIFPVLTEKEHRKCDAPRVAVGAVSFVGVRT